MSVDALFDSCDGGYLRAYVRGQDPLPGTEDYELCGTVPEVSLLTTENPRLLLVFNSTGAAEPTRGHGFRAEFKFETGLMHCRFYRANCLVNI